MQKPEGRGAVASGPEDLAAVLIDALNRLLSGEISPTAANAIGYLVSHLLKLHEYNAKNAGENDAPVINIPQRLLPNPDRTDDRTG